MSSLCIIGSGLSGLSVARHALQASICGKFEKIVIFDDAACVGGNWSAFGSSALKTNLSAATCAFPDLSHTLSRLFCSESAPECPLDAPWAHAQPASSPFVFPSAPVMSAYLRTYAATHGIDGHVRFKCRVTSLVPVRGNSDLPGSHGWDVTFSEPASQTVRTERYSAVVLAGGSFRVPLWPASIVKLLPAWSTDDSSAVASPSRDELGTSMSYRYPFRHSSTHRYACFGGDVVTTTIKDMHGRVMPDIQHASVSYLQGAQLADAQHSMTLTGCDHASCSSDAPLVRALVVGASFSGMEAVVTLLQTNESVGTVAPSVVPLLLVSPSRYILLLPRNFKLTTECAALLPGSNGHSSQCPLDLILYARQAGCFSPLEQGGTAAPKPPAIPARVMRLVELGATLLGPSGLQEDYSVLDSYSEMPPTAILDEPDIALVLRAVVAGHVELRLGSILQDAALCKCGACSGTPPSSADAIRPSVLVSIASLDHSVHQEVIATRRLIIASGFCPDVSFLSEEVRSVMCSEPEPDTLCDAKGTPAPVNAYMPFVLFRGVLPDPSQLRNIAVVGGFRGPFFGQVDLMARVALAYFSGRLVLPPLRFIADDIRAMVKLTHRPRPQLPFPYQLLAVQLSSLLGCPLYDVSTDDIRSVAVRGSLVPALLCDDGVRALSVPREALDRISAEETKLQAFCSSAANESSIGIDPVEWSLREIYESPVQDACVPSVPFSAVSTLLGLFGCWQLRRSIKPDDSALFQLIGIGCWVPLNIVAPVSSMPSTDNSSSTSPLESVCDDVTSAIMRSVGAQSGDIVALYREYLNPLPGQVYPDTMSFTSAYVYVASSSSNTLSVWRFPNGAPSFCAELGSNAIVLTKMHSLLFKHTPPDKKLVELVSEVVASTSIFPPCLCCKDTHMSNPTLELWARGGDIGAGTIPPTWPISASDKHLCEADHYRGSYVIALTESSPFIGIVHRVDGTSKAYVSVSTLTKCCFDNLCSSTLSSEQSAAANVAHLIYAAIEAAKLVVETPAIPKALHTLHPAALASRLSISCGGLPFAAATPAGAQYAYFISTCDRWAVLAIPLVTSTMDISATILTNPFWKPFADVPIAVAAISQSASRGTSGRRWLGSYRGNLHLTMCLPSKELERRERSHLLGVLPLLVGLSIREGISSVFGSRVDMSNIKLKWPNDIVWCGSGLPSVLPQGSAAVDDACSQLPSPSVVKLAGTLIEMTDCGKLCIGIGVNVSSAPRVRDGRATGALGGDGACRDSDALMRGILMAFDKNIDRFTSAKQLVEKCRECMALGVQFRLRTEPQHTVTAVKLLDDGSLEVLGPAGKQVILSEYLD